MWPYPWSHCKGDQRREQFTRWLDSQRYEDGSTSLAWVEVQYGDNDGETRIVRDSDGERAINHITRT